MLLAPELTLIDRDGLSHGRPDPNSQPMPDYRRMTAFHLDVVPNPWQVRNQRIHLILSVALLTFSFPSLPPSPISRSPEEGMLAPSSKAPQGGAGIVRGGGESTASVAGTDRGVCVVCRSGKRWSVVGVPNERNQEMVGVGHFATTQARWRIWEIFFQILWLIAVHGAGYKAL